MGSVGIGDDGLTDATTGTCKNVSANTLMSMARN